MLIKSPIVDFEEITSKIIPEITSPIVKIPGSAPIIISMIGITIRQIAGMRMA